MSIWKRFLGWLRMERRSGLARPEPWLMEAFGAHPTVSGVHVTPDAAMRVAAVFACVRLLAETVASLPLHLYRRTSGGGKERATDHPLYDLLHDRPNPLMTSAEMREALMASMLLRGPGFVEVRRGPDGMVRELVPLHPDRVRIESGPDGRHLRYIIDGGERVLRTGEVWHPRGFSFDGIHAVSPITYAREAIGLAIAAEQHGAATFANAARPAGILSHPGKLSDEAERRLAQSWERFRGRGAGGVAVLEEGITWTPLTMSAEDAQYIETRKFQLSEIARIFRVPPHMIGDLERATFSNIEHQSIDFVRHTLRPWLVRLEQSISRDLLLPSERRAYFAEFTVEGLLRGDTAARYQAHAIAVSNGWMSRNEVREIENLNPVPGLDDYLVPLNMAPATSSVPEGVDDGEANDAAA